MTDPYKCPRCEKPILRMSGIVYIDSSWDLFMNITKTALRRKDIKVMYAFWDRTVMLCRECGFCIVPRLDVTQKLRRDKMLEDALAAILMQSSDPLAREIALQALEDKSHLGDQS